MLAFENGPEPQLTRPGNSLFLVIFRAIVASLCFLNRCMECPCIVLQSKLKWSHQRARLLDVVWARFVFFVVVVYDVSDKAGRQLRVDYSAWSCHRIRKRRLWQEFNERQRKKRGYKLRFRDGNWKSRLIVLLQKEVMPLREAARQRETVDV